MCTFRKFGISRYAFEPRETSADIAEVSFNSMQSGDFSDGCSGENVNVEGHVAIDNGNSGEEIFRLFSAWL